MYADKLGIRMYYKDLLVLYLMPALTSYTVHYRTTILSSALPSNVAFITNNPAIIKLLQ